MDTENQKMERIHWTDMVGNPFVHPIDLMMLTSCGLQKHVKCYIAGQSVKHSKPVVRIVTFDISFVEAKVKKLLLDPLQQETLMGVDRLIKKGKGQDESN